MMTSILLFDKQNIARPLSLVIPQKGQGLEKGTPKPQPMSNRFHQKLHNFVHFSETN